MVQTFDLEMPFARITLRKKRREYIVDLCTNIVITRMLETGNVSFNNELLCIAQNSVCEEFSAAVRGQFMILVC